MAKLVKNTRDLDIPVCLVSDVQSPGRGEDGCRTIVSLVLDLEKSMLRDVLRFPEKEGKALFNFVEDN